MPGSRLQREEALRVGAHGDRDQHRENRERPGIGVSAEQAPRRAADADHEREIGIEQGEHLAQVGADQSADPSGNPRHDARDAPRRTARQHGDGLNGDRRRRRKRAARPQLTRSESSRTVSQRMGLKARLASRSIDALRGAQRPEREAGGAESYPADRWRPERAAARRAAEERDRH